MFRLGSVVVAVEVIVWRESGRVFYAAGHTGRRRGPAAGSVVGTMLVIAVQTRRRVASIVSTVGRSRVATLGAVSVAGRSSEDGRCDAVVVLAMTVLVGASWGGGLGRGRCRLRVAVSARAMSLISVCVRIRSLMSMVAVGCGSAAMTLALGSLQLV